MHFLVKTIALLLIAISIFACKKPTIDNKTEFFPINNPVAMGDRTIGMHITIPEYSDYETEILRSKELGITAFPFTFFWDFLEPDSGIYNFEPLQAIDIFFPYYNSKVSPCITPIKYIDRGLPADLMNKSFNDTTVINRFKTLLDSIHTYLSNTELSGLIIGNEIDLYFNQHPSEWSEYKDFYHAVCPYAQQLWNNQVDVGTEVCRETLCTHYPVQLQEINQVSDIIAVSYYPIDASYHGKEMSEIEADFDEILQLYPTQKIYIEETGYPTGQHNLSNELKQSQYINFLFSYWDKHPTQIVYIGMLWLTEISDNLVNTFVEDYGMSSSTELDAFKDFLQTTAFREYDNMGKNKHGYLQLIEEIKAR
jgi:hypothetical protein